MAADVYVSFGSDTGDLEAGLALATQSVKAYTAELRDLAREMQVTGASADSELGEKMRSVGAMLATAKGNVSEFKAELKGGGEEGGAFDHIKESIEGMLAPLNQARGYLGELMELALAAFAVEAIAEFAEKMGELGEQTEHASQIMGITTEDVGRLGVVAAESGLQTEELETAWGRFSKNLATQSAQTKGALEAIGLSFKSLAGKDAMGQLGILAGAFSQYSDGSAKAAVAMELFGRAGLQLIPLLDKGKDGMAEMTEKAEELGVALTEKTSAALANTHERFVELSLAVRGAEVQAFLPFKGAVDGVVQIITDLAEAFTRAMMQGGMMKDIIVALSAVVKLCIEVVADLIAVFRELWTDGVAAYDAIGIAGEAFYHLTVGIFTDLAAGVGQFFSSMLAAGVDAARGVGAAFENLGSVIKDAMGGHFADASEAFSKLSTDASGAATKITADFGAAFDGVHFDGTEKAFSTAMGAIKQRATEFKSDQVSIYNDLTKEVNTIWAKAQEKDADAAKKGTKDINSSLMQRGRGARQDDGVAAEQKEIDGEIKVLQDGLKQKEALYDGELKLHQITEGQKEALTLAAVNEEYQAELGLLQKELQIDNLKLSQRQAILNKIKELEATHAAEVQKINLQAAEAYQKSWDSALSTITQGFNSQLSGLLNGTTNWRTAMQNIVRDLEIKVIQYGEDMVKNWLLGEVTKTAATTTGVAARTAAEQSGQAAGMAGTFASMIKSIFASAATTFAGIFGFLSPVMGPAAAGPATAGSAAVAAVAGSIPSLAVGTWSLPGDGPVFAHAGEMITPAFESGKFRDAINALSSVGQGGSSQGGATHNWNFAGATVLDKNGLVRMLVDTMNRNPSLRPSY